MVTINNPDLRNTYLYLSTIENILRKEVRQINGNKNYVDKIVPDQFTRIFSLKEKSALTFADNLTRTAYENSVVSIVATFEKIVFAKYRTSYGLLKRIVSEKSTRPLDYYKSREYFINDKIDRLSGIIFLLEGQFSSTLLRKLKLIKDHRNYIAHGKRDVAPPAVELNLEEIALVLDEVIGEIES